MIPYERDMYIGMVNNWAKEETERLKQKNIENQQQLTRIVKSNKRRK